MAIKKESLTKIAGLLKIKTEDIEAAIAAEGEVELAIPDGLNVLTADDLEARDTNTKNEAIKVGKEIGVKEVRKAAGLEEGIGVDATKIASAIAEKAMKDAKIEPDKKVNELKDQITQLQGVVSQKDTEIANIQKSAKQVQLDATIMKALPKNRSTNLDDEDYLNLVKSSLEFEEADGAIIVKKGGQPLRHETTKNPLGISEALETHFKEKKWITEGGAGGAGGAGGRGGGNNGGPKVYTKLSELKAEWEAAGKSLQGAEFTAKMAEVQKENPEFDAES